MFSSTLWTLLNCCMLISIGAKRSVHGQTSLIQRASVPAAIGQSDAKRVLVPVNHCDNIVVGVGDIPMAKLVQSAVKEIGKGS